MWTLFKILTWIWPFIWEGIVGKMTFREALRNNKRKVFISLVLALSIFLNFWFGAKIIAFAKLQQMDVDRRDLAPPAREKVIEPTPVGGPPLLPKGSHQKETTYDRYHFVTGEIEAIKHIEKRY